MTVIIVAHKTTARHKKTTSRLELEQFSLIWFRVEHAMVSPSMIQLMQNDREIVHPENVLSLNVADF